MPVNPMEMYEALRVQLGITHMAPHYIRRLFHICRAP